MFNMVRMDLYRMFRTKSLYVIWIVMAATMLLTTSLSLIVQEMPELQEYTHQETTENVNLGMSVSLPTLPGEQITVLDEVYANTTAKFTALFFVIFAVIFATADINSGYIKNIGGQVRNRGALFLSKAVAMLVFTALTMLGYVLLQALFCRICFGYLVWGNICALLWYLGIQILLHYALTLICMAIAVLLRNNVLSMILVICMCGGVSALLYGLIDNLIHKLGFSDFQLMKYTVTGQIALVPIEPSSDDVLMPAVISVAFLLAMSFIGNTVFAKKDC
ncbi:ABC transporter permease [Lachnospiraceae bacterium 46-15]